MKDNDPAFPVSCCVRFEDLKLYPKETTEKFCEFLRIPQSESCLHITTNGENSGIVDGTAGFDVTPVYKTHPEHLSTLDYYRIELLNAKNFQIQGYKLRYYDGTKYTPEDLKKLFDIPFKVETFGLYSSRAENVLGVTMKMEEPKNPDVVINNNGQELVEDIVERILSNSKNDI